MKRLPVLLFDIGNVFIFADHEITHRHLIEMYKVFPSKARQFYTIHEYITFSEGKITGKQYAQAIRNLLEKPSLTDKQIRHAHDIHLVRPIQSAITVLEKLWKQQSYQLAFITNTNEWQTKKENQIADFSQYSNIIIRSNEEGLTKQDPEIFIRAIKRIGNKNILFIDDSETNIKTARSLGIESLHVTKNKPNLSMMLASAGINVRE